MFVDIDPATFNLLPAAVEAAITPRTRAIMVVHLFGQMARYDADPRHRGEAWTAGDRGRGPGDRRPAAGRPGHGAMAGELGTVGAFSFFPSKNLGGWGDGGMMVTQDDALAERLRRLRTHGGSQQYHHDEVGYNSRLDTLQAAVLLAKLPHLAGWSAARRERAARYTAAFAGLAGGVPAEGRTRRTSTFSTSTPCGWSGATTLVTHLKGAGDRLRGVLPARRCTCSPVSLTWATGGAVCPATEAATTSVVSLPIYPELTSAQQDAVIETVTGLLRVSEHRERMKVAVVGSGYVGLVTGACFAETGNDVVCADIDARKVERLKANDIPIYEPGLEDMVRRNQAEGRLTFTTDVGAAVDGSRVVFIAVGHAARTRTAPPTCSTCCRWHGPSAGT